MIISCQQCTTQFHLDSHLIQPSGTKVRCSKCHHIFMAFLSVGAGNNASVTSPAGVGGLDLDDFDGDPIDRIDADLQASGFLEDAHDGDTAMGGSGEWQSEDNDMPDLADELDKILGPDDTDDGALIDDIDDAFGQDAQITANDDQDFVDLEDGLDDLLGGDLLAEEPFHGEVGVTETNDAQESASDGLELTDLEDGLDDLLGGDLLAEEPFRGEVDVTETNNAQESASDDLGLSDFEDGLDDLLGEDFLGDDQSDVQEITVEDLIDGDDEIEVLDLSTLEDVSEDASEELLEADQIIENAISLDLEPESSEEIAPESSEEISMSELEKALDLAESTEDGLDFDLGGDLSAEGASDIEEDAETDPDLDLASLLNEEEEAQERVGTDTIAIEDLTDQSDDDGVSAEESAGLDTIQIEDFEFDLENLDEIEPQADASEAISDQEIEPDLVEPDLIESGMGDEEIESKDLITDDVEVSLADDAKLDSEVSDGLEIDPIELNGEENLYQELDQDKELDQESDSALDIGELESFDLDLEDTDLVDSTTDEAEKVDDGEFKADATEEIDDVTLDTDQDTDQIGLLEEEYDGLEEIKVSDEEPSTEDAVSDDAFSLDTSMLESFNEELDDLEVLISPEDETPLEETVENDDELELNLEEIDLDDSKTGDSETPANAEELSHDEEGSDPNDSFALDTRQIESFDLDIENLDEIGSDEDDTASDDRMEPDMDMDLDAIDIEGLDLEVADPNGLDLPGDDFILDKSEVDALDLELSDGDVPAAEIDQDSGDNSDDMDIALDADQIESLNLELESTDMSVSEDEGNGRDTNKKEPTVVDKKTADVLNLDLERPDLDGADDLDDGVDLPILDELLAPAEVVDDTLLEESVDLDSTVPAEGESESKDSEFDFMDQLEEVPPEDSLPVLELDDIDKKVDDTEKDVESVVDSATGEHPGDGIPKEKAVSGVIQEKGADAHTPKTMSEIEESDKAPIPPGRFESVPKRKTSKLLLALLILVLLFGLLVGLNAVGVKIPGLDRLSISSLIPGSGKVVDESGRTRIKTADINSKFVSNEKSGQLFVITGKAVNQYDKKRESIQIKGDIYASGGKQVASQVTLCGNMLSDSDLTTKPVAELQRLLADKVKAKNSGGLIAEPGKTLPFMIVFSGLPPDIEEFSVEVFGSKTP